MYAVEDVRMVRDATKQRTSLSLLLMRRRTGDLGVVWLSLPHTGCAGLHPAELGNSGPITPVSSLLPPCHRNSTQARRHFFFHINGSLINRSLTINH